MPRKDYGLKPDDAGTFHCDFSVAGRRFQRSTFTASLPAAQEFCAALAERAWREIKLKEKPQLQWQEAVALWFKEKESNHKKDLANDEDKKLVLAPLLDGKMLHELHVEPKEEGVNLTDMLDALQLDRGIVNSTRNRYAAFINGVLNHVRGKGYQVPVFKVPKLREIHEESRALTQGTDEAERLFAELARNLHLIRPARFSLACGHRQSNVFGLRKFRERYARDGALLPHITDDFKTMFVPGGWAKGGKLMRIPLNDEAAEIAREACACKTHGHPSIVFAYYGKFISQPANSAFKKAVARADLEGFTWHGFRHTWTTWHLENETPVEVVQKLGGWSSIQILLKHYAHLLDKHTAKYAGNVALPTPAKPAPALRSVA